MPTSSRNAAAVRQSVEERLASRVPRALTPAVRSSIEQRSSGIAALDQVLHGGLPVGAITELVGAECSGRTTMALAYLAATLQAGNVAAWVDVEDRLDPTSAALCGVDCDRLLWVRCASGRHAATALQAAPGHSTGSAATAVGPQATGMPRGGGSHPRSESRGMDRAVQHLLLKQQPPFAVPPPRVKIGTPSSPNLPFPSRSTEREEQVASDRQPKKKTRPEIRRVQMRPIQVPTSLQHREPAWPALEKAMRATDLILQSGGFALIVMDLGSTPAEMAWRIPLASWFRYRAACERTRASLLLLTRHPCARSSAECTVRMQPGQLLAMGGVLTGIDFLTTLERVRFSGTIDNVVPLRKPPQPVHGGNTWKGQAAWAV